jgi:anaerobic ribonucleoside-triphosphate reductase activating protein
MKYEIVKTTFNEVPNEVSLTFLITGCPLACEGCHSSQSWENNGTELTEEHLLELILKYEFIISTVCFLGGEWERENMVSLLKIVKSSNLKTCLYTGLNKVHPDIENELDFIKTGRWISTLGGLTSKTTNQKFIDLNNKKDLSILFLK